MKIDLINFFYFSLSIKAANCTSDVGLTCLSGVCVCSDTTKAFNGTMCGKENKKFNTQMRFVIHAQVFNMLIIK